MRLLGRFALALVVGGGTFGCGGSATVQPGDGDTGTGDDTALTDDTGIFVQPDAPTGCTKLTCADQGKNCGKWSDGWGGLTDDCGTCASGETCGAVTPSVCGVGTCTTKKTCADLGANCGMQGDGCEIGRAHV